MASSRAGTLTLWEDARDVERRAIDPPGREDDGGDRRELRVILLRRPELVAVHHRHHEVEQDQARKCLAALERWSRENGAPDNASSSNPVPAFRCHGALSIAEITDRCMTTDAQPR